MYDNEINRTKEIRDRLQEIKPLLNRKEAKLRELEELDNKIQQILMKLSSGTKVVKRNRPKTSALDYYLIRAMAPGAHMSTNQVADKVLSLGYETQATRSSLKKHINARLNTRPDMQTVKRGLFTRTLKLKQEGSITHDKETDQTMDNKDRGEDSHL